MKTGIYKIENQINHHLYIGKAKNIEQRWSAHKSNAKNMKENHLYRAMRKYGIENFSFDIIEEIPIEKYDLISSEKEKYWIKYYHAYIDPNNYNETEGGEGVTGWIPSEEWKEKQSKSRKKWYQTKEGKEKAKKQSEQMKNNNINNGRKHTEQWKKEHSQCMQGTNNPNYGKHTQGKKCLCIELNQIFNSTREAAKIIGVAHTNIVAACRGQQKTAGGYHWQYLAEDK